MEAQAIVAREPSASFQPSLKLETVTVGAPGDDEVLVEIHAAGICHTDLLFASIPSAAGIVTYPKILGHEGEQI